MESSLTGFTRRKREKVEVPTKLMIVGAGPAGYSAALYAARAALEPVVLTGPQPGGQAAITFHIENYPGFPEGIGGAALGELFHKQAEQFGAILEADEATAIDVTAKPMRVETYGKVYLAEALILAMGANPTHLNIPGEERLTGRGVSYCATCDGAFFKDKKVMVVGGGDSALEEAIFLTRYASEVTIVHRRDEFRAGAILQSRALAQEKIKVLYNTIALSVNGENAVETVTLKNVLTEEITDYPVDGFFIFIGHKPNTQLLAGQLEMDENNFLIVDSHMQTSVPGVFAAGEIADPTFKQVVTSAGMGAAAAIAVTRYLEALEG